jgi:hypothetical protein
MAALLGDILDEVEKVAAPGPDEVVMDFIAGTSCGWCPTVVVDYLGTPMVPTIGGNCIPCMTEEIPTF